MSDDEDDTHPNVDTASLFKWRHEARVERMEKEKKEKLEIEERKMKNRKEILVAEEKLKNADEKERQGLKLSLIHI